jgi:hypothetical protein
MGSSEPSVIPAIATRNSVTLSTAPCTTPFLICLSSERVLPTATLSPFSYKIADELQHFSVYFPSFQLSSDIIAVD